MSIGLYDMDMNTYTLVPFNLEIMKLAAYYKKKGEIVVLSPTYCPERHTKFIIRKDYNDGNYPPQFATTPNVEYGGNAFTNNTYKPLPLEIEMMKPDSSIYTKMQSVIEQAAGYETATKKKIFKNMMEAEHCRLSLDGKTIWGNYEKQFHYLPAARNLMLHDYDLAAIPGSFEVVQDILAHARTDGWATRVGMKYPVRVHQGEDLLKWCSLRPNSTFYSLEYDGVIPNDAFNEFVGQVREQSIYKQLDYYITAGSCDPNDFIKNSLPQIFKQVIISRSYRVFFTLKYEDEFFFDPMWEKVIELMNFYHNSLSSADTSTYLCKIGNDTMYDFANNTTNKKSWYSGEIYSRNEIREIFAFVRENQPELFQMFYECTANSLGGKL